MPIGISANRVMRGIALAGCVAGLATACASVNENSGVHPARVHAAGSALDRDVARLANEAFATAGMPGAAPATIKVAAFNRASLSNSASVRTDHHEAAFRDDETQSENHSTIAGGRGLIVTVQGGETSGGWRELEDAYFHEFSGFLCNKSEITLGSLSSGGAFQVTRLPLKNIYVFDAQGFDIGCNYANPEAGFYFTVYASRWPSVSLDDHFASAINDIFANMPISKEAFSITSTNEKEGDAPSTIEGDTKAAAFLLESDSRRAAFKTALWLNKTGDWHVKGRATFPVAIQNGEPDFAMVEIFLSSLYDTKLNEVDVHINTTAAQTVSYQKR